MGEHFRLFSGVLGYWGIWEIFCRIKWHKSPRTYRRTIDHTVVKHFAFGKAKSRLKVGFFGQLADTMVGLVRAHNVFSLLALHRKPQQKNTNWARVSSLQGWYKYWVKIKLWKKIHFQIICCSYSLELSSQSFSCCRQLYPDEPDNYYLWLVPSPMVKPFSALQVRR